MRVPFIDLSLEYQEIREELIETFDQVCSKGSYILGEELERFEQAVADFCETKFAVGVANGGDAITLCLKVLGVERDDEVIIPAHSFLATMTSVISAGAKPVLVDVAEDFNIDPNLIEPAITSKTRAIIPVHLNGRPAKMNEINSIAKKHCLHVIEDAAQSIGATYYAKKTGGLSDAGCFSLHPLKNLNLMGDGGIITTHDENIASQLRLLRNYGLKNRDEAIVWGVNSRLDNLQAAFGLVKLKRLAKWNKRYQEIAKFYYENLHDVVKCLPPNKNLRSVYHNFVIQVHANQRDELMRFLLEQGIETKIHYPVPLHLQPIAKRLSYQQSDFPITEKIIKEIVSLPIYPFLKDGQIEFVCQSIGQFFHSTENTF